MIPPILVDVSIFLQLLDRREGVTFLFGYRSGSMISRLDFDGSFFIKLSKASSGPWRR